MEGPNGWAATGGGEPAITAYEYRGTPCILERSGPPMKKLNLPLLLFLVFGSIGLLIGIYLLHRYQINRIADNLAVRAEQAQGENDLSEQVRLLSRYLRYRPKDVEQFKQLLTVSRESLEATPSDPEVRNLFFGLFPSLQRAVIEHPEDPELRRDASRIALLYYAGSRNNNERFLKEAMDHLGELERLGKLTSEDQVALARCKLGINEKAAAIEKLSELIGFDPENHTFDANDGEGLQRRFQPTACWQESIRIRTIPLTTETPWSLI